MGKMKWVGVLLAMPMLMGAEGDGCGNPAFSESPAPDMSGTWDVTYDDRLDVTIQIGGAVYTEELGATGGVVTIDHEGQPIMFDLSCDQEAVVCPSEVWPASVGFRQDDAMYPHRVFLQLPEQNCDMPLRMPATDECGEGTTNPDCDMVCDGEITAGVSERFGTINEAGDAWQVLLGAGFATNGINCALLGASVAAGDLTTSGSAMTEDWDASATTGDVTTVYAGGCLWAGDPDMDAELEALVIGASVRFETGFDATKRPGR